MADIKLFNIKGNVKEYQSGTVTLEPLLKSQIDLLFKHEAASEEACNNYCDA